MDDFQAVFDRIRPMYAAHEAKCVVLRDGPQGYILGSQEVRERTATGPGSAASRSGRDMSPLT